MLGLQFDERLDIADNSSNSASRPQFVAILAHVREHSIDVTDVEGSSAGKSEVDLLDAEFLHVIDQFNLLFNLWIPRTGAL